MTAEDVNWPDAMDSESIMFKLSGQRPSMSSPSNGNAKRCRDEVLQGDEEEVSERPQKTIKSDLHSETTSQIAPLLDFTSLTSASAISERFDVISNALFRDYQLVVTHGDVRTPFQILEMEFYLQKPGDHEDPFTHGSEEQKKSGQWYFHRVPKHGAAHFVAESPGGYRSGSRKGLDLTFGSPVIQQSSTSQQHVTTGNITRGGILLRTLRRMSDRKLFSGPSLLVDEILRLSGTTSITELVQQKWCGDISAWPSPSASRSSHPTLLCLEQKTDTTSLKRPPIYRSPRIGLDLSHFSTTESLTHPRVVYVSKPYRYFIHPELLTTKGRAQTFLGVYQTCRASGRNTSNEFGLKREIIRLAGFSEKTTEKYLSDYKDGLRNGSLKNFIGARGKGVSGSPSTCLKLFGTLARLQNTVDVAQ